jgi:hypothetical protein
MRQLEATYTNWVVFGRHVNWLRSGVRNLGFRPLASSSVSNLFWPIPGKLIAKDKNKTRIEFFINYVANV